MPFIIPIRDQVSSLKLVTNNFHWKRIRDYLCASFKTFEDNLLNYIVVKVLISIKRNPRKTTKVLDLKED